MPNWVTAVFAIATGIGAIAGAVMGVRKCVAPVRKVIGVFNDFAGEPARPGVAARPGLVESVANIKAEQFKQGAELAAIRESQDAHGTALELQGRKLDKVSHEMFPNSGLSMRDSVDRIEEFIGITPPLPPSPPRAAYTLQTTITSPPTISSPLPGLPPL